MIRTVHEFMADLTPEHRQVVEGMLAKASISNNSSLEEALDTLQLQSNYERLGYNEKLLMIAMWSDRKSKWASKLTFDQRCQILALHRAGITRDLLATAFGVDRRTISHIYNEGSAHYKSVRDEEKNLGRDAFINKYAGLGTMDHLLAFRQIKEKVPEKNNPEASRRSGPHTVRGKFCETPHRVFIAWKEVGDRMSDTDQIEVAGWYYNDLDGNFPNVWQFSDDKSRSTSDCCYRAMLDNLVDK